MAAKASCSGGVCTASWPAVPPAHVTLQMASGRATAAACQKAQAGAPRPHLRLKGRLVRVLRLLCLHVLQE